MSVAVYSEVAPLRTVVVHRPGAEIVRMTQQDLEYLLFDDILAEDMAAAEHDVLAQILGADGAQVLKIEALLAEALQRAPEDAVAALVQRICVLDGVRELAPVLLDEDRATLGRQLIHGVFWSELPGSPVTVGRLRARIDEGRAALRPVPNLMFMRDGGVGLYDRVLVSRMATEARAREPHLVRFALRWSERAPVQPETLIFDEDDSALPRVYRSIEGGDVLVPSERFLLIGCSARTTAETIERLTREVLLPAFPHLQRVYAVMMPRERSVMHLDTILTQLDHGLFLGHVPMVVGQGPDDGLKAVVLERNRPPRLLERSLLEILRDELGEVELAPCGGDDPLHQRREQWTDGANAVCLSPGRAVLYQRNVHTIETLRDRFGFEVVVLSSLDAPDVRAQILEEALTHPRVVFAFSGNELSRARGGGRCLTMPLNRASS